MINADKITEFFCAVDEFCKEFDGQMGKKSLLSSDGKVRRYRKASLSVSEIMTILIVFPEDFMFELTKEEYNSLRCQTFTLKNADSPNA